MMNRDSSASSGKTDIEDIIDLVCREFELKFRSDPAFRVEQMLDMIPRYVAGFNSDSKRAVAIQAVVEELIFVEMDMRRAAGQFLAANEYFDRFPNFFPAIRESFNRQRQLHRDFRENSSVATVVKDGNSRTGDLDNQLRLDLQREASIPKEFGPYREITAINSGGFGIVCRASDSRDGRVVALKFPRKDKLKDDPELKLFLAEANKAMMLDHPGIVRTYSIESTDGFLAIVQQFIDGLDLKAAKGQLGSQKEIARLVEKVAEALAYAHQKGIYHRDLKPGNILIDRKGHPYVADFGLALEASEQMHLPKQRCGTPHYMPPEQAAGLTRLLDGRSDIWSLGVILYELLTKHRPFEGSTTSDIFDQIENKDPRPPRQIDSSIDSELQRICLKCLERQQRDRYLTADELADDLRHWAARPEPKIGAAETRSPMIPKGLRSYSAEDAAFFLDLLPGPRDRDGLPSSIRFWKARIVEPVAPENRVPVGVMFGPSGSGKSSFIKAGLLPQLGREVLTVYVEATTFYVEATQADTEVRLLKALRQRLDDVPDEISLPELFRGLSYGKWVPANYRKLLIVIDQFEQRLSRAVDHETSQLARALRYCDGEHVQCLLLTRDDFMTALSRFTDALEMDLRQGENAQAIDLFDRKHARKVLAGLGRAYGQLPAEPAELSDEQESFLDEAVKQLAEDDRVICVRLALFAEMFRHRPWTPTELKLVGGVAGTGEKFLEATFGPGSRDKRHRLQRESAQRVLKTLLPAAGTDIRGAMKPEQDLIAAANLQNQPEQFDDLIKSLDGQLKLITRTDPVLPQDVERKNPDASIHNSWYQLTHDYLVPSVRSWLDSTLGLTRAGRARLRLRDLAAQVVPGQSPPNLPTNVEWLAWQFQIPSSGLGGNERLVIHSAGRRFLRQAAIAMAILLLLGTFATYAIYQNAYENRIDYVDGLIDDLIHQEVSKAPEIVNKLNEQRAIAESKLRAIVNDPTSLPSVQLRASMGLLPFDSNYSDRLFTAITAPDCSPEELEALVEILARYGEQPLETLRNLVDDSTANPRSRFRAACAEIILKQSQRDWTQQSQMMASVLWDEPITFLDSWIAILKNKGRQFDSTFSNLLRTPDDVTNGTILDGNKAFVLANALYSFKQPAVCLPELAAFIPTANDIRFNAIMLTIEKHGAADAMADAVEQFSVDPKDAIAVANKAIALMRLGRKQELVDLYCGEFDSVPTFLAINFSTSTRLRLHELRELYERQAVANNENVNLRRSMLQALALQSNNILGDEPKQWLAKQARFHILNDLDACCFSTAELIVRRLESDSIEDLRAQRRNQKQNGTDVEFGNVMINDDLTAFSIVEIPKLDGENYKLAVATSEVTNHELFQKTKDESLKLKPASQPFQFNKNSILVAFRYCNSLSDESQSFYPREVSVADIAGLKFEFARSGNRLPTNVEWMAFSKSNRVMEGLLAGWPKVATNYAWVYENSQNELRDVCRLLPNAAGLFDTFGNVFELCHETGTNEPFVEKGLSIRVGCKALSVAESYPVETYFDRPSALGFRIVQTSISHVP